MCMFVVEVCLNKQQIQAPPPKKTHTVKGQKHIKTATFNVYIAFFVGRNMPNSLLKSTNNYYVTVGKKDKTQPK